MSGTAVPPQARVMPTLWKMVGFWLGHKHGPCQASGHARLNCFHFFASYLDKYLQNKLKQHKTNKIKAIKTRGLPPTKRLFKVISLTIKRFLYPIPNLSQRDNDIKLSLSPKSHMAFSIVSDPMTRGMEKLSGSLSLDGNLS